MMYTSASFAAYSSYRFAYCSARRVASQPPVPLNRLEPNLAITILQSREINIAFRLFRVFFITCKVLGFSKHFEIIYIFWCSDRGISGRFSSLGAWLVPLGGTLQ